MPDPLILAFDTSSAHCAAALLRGPEILGEAFEPMARGQAERLMPMLAEMLEAAGHDWLDPDAIGVGIGPGTFTGVRVAVAAARGLALARAIPAIGVTALDAAALDAPPGRLAVAPSGRGWYGVRAPGDTPRLVAEVDLSGEPRLVGWAPGAEPPAHALAVAIARIARARLHAPGPRPAPLYLRPPDAAPARAAAPPVAAG